MKCALLVVVVMLGCKKEEQPQLVVAALGSGTVAVAVQGVTRRPEWIVGKPSTFARPARERNATEKLLFGTWVAKVGDYATKSAFMADRTMYAVNAKPGGDTVTAVIDALEKDTQVKSNCVWIELREDGTGFRRECMIANGEPSALDQNDPVTGAKKDFGVPLTWYFEETKPAGLHVHFAADMLAPMVEDGAMKQLVFHDWNLAMGAKVADNTFEITESFPEHDYTLPQHYAYEIVAQRFLGQ